MGEAVSRTLSISVIVPYRPDRAWRDRAWLGVVAPFWDRVIDEWPADAELLVEEPKPSGPGHPGDFNHPLAINRAAQRSTGDLLFVADADTIPDEAYLYLVERAMRDGREQWGLPLEYRKLNREATEDVLLGDPGATRSDLDYEWVGTGVSWSGCVAVPRQAFFDVGGYDERIAWWGADDVAFGVTMTTLYGNPYRVAGVTHLWHPDPLEHNYGHERHAAQQRLVDRYTAAAGDAHGIRRVRDSGGAFQ